MKTMTWEEIDKDWSGLQKRHRMEIGEAVARYCIGHKMEDLASRLNHSYNWVVNQLDYAGIGMALGSQKVLMTCVLLCSGFAGSANAVEGFDFVYYTDASEDQEGKAYGTLLVAPFGRVDEEVDTTNLCDPDSGGISYDHYAEGEYYRFSGYYNTLNEYSQASHIDYSLGAYTDTSDIVAVTTGWASTGGMGALECTETGVATGSISFKAYGNGGLAHTEARQNLYASFGDSNVRAIYSPPPTDLWTVTGTTSNFPFVDKTINKTYAGWNGLDGESFPFAEPVLSGATYYINTQANYNEENWLTGWSSGSASTLNRNYTARVRVE